MTVLDIRGTHGSGKSYVVHSLLQKYLTEDLKDGKDVIGYRLPQINCAVIGRYDRQCGGCDGIKTADEVERRIRLLAPQYDYVVLEGILVAHTFSRYSKIASDLASEGIDYRFLFLNTPLFKCIARVRARRRKRGNNKPFDPRNVIKDYERIWHRLRIQCVNAGHEVGILDWRDPMSVIRSELRGDRDDI